MDESFVFFLAACVPPPPDNTHEVRELLKLFLALAHIPQPSQSIRFRHFAEDENVFTDRNVYSELSENRYHFYQITGETSETMIDLQNLIVLHDTREHMLSARNRVLLFVIWLRMYSTYNLLSNMFGVSVTVVGTEITSLLPVFCEKLDHFLVWPTEEDWRSMLGVWTKLPMAVGAIDGSSHRIYRPGSGVAGTVLFRTPALSLPQHSCMAQYGT